MNLSKRAIKEFQEIYLEEFGENISNKKANEIGLRLLLFFQIIYRPTRKEEHESREEKKTLRREQVNEKSN